MAVEGVRTDKVDNTGVVTGEGAEDTPAAAGTPSARTGSPTTPVSTDGVDPARRGTTRVESDSDRRLRRLEEEQQRTQSTMASQQAQAARGERELSTLETIGFSLVEILEFLARIFLPIVNLISMCVRLLRMLTHIGDENFDWKGEFIRLGADALGTFVPGIGGYIAASVNAGMNIFDPFGDPNHKGNLQILGFDMGRNDPLRTGFDGIVGAGKSVFEGGRRLVTGQARESGDISHLPVAPDLATN